VSLSRACVSIPYLNVELILLSSFGVKFACARGTRVAPSQRPAATTNPSIVERVDLCCCPFHWQRALKPCRPWIGCIESTICWIAKEYERDCKRPLIYDSDSLQYITLTCYVYINIYRELKYIYFYISILQDESTYIVFIFIYSTT
jgi:hypothetical protein